MVSLEIPPVTRGGKPGPPRPPRPSTCTSEPRSEEEAPGRDVSVGHRERLFRWRLPSDRPLSRLTLCSQLLPTAEVTLGSKATHGTLLLGVYDRFIPKVCDPRLSLWASPAYLCPRVLGPRLGCRHLDPGTHTVTQEAGEGVGAEPASCDSEEKHLQERL